jgi:chromosome segregation protein
MADVIFNGSGSRRPVGQASVEIVFDNSDGSLGGQYSGYNQIAVKRQVSRDGQSIYFLNGSRCRRRDITGIFLGTGLGPRSYAIIEQGMISRLIEAKPEELREFLEEAAGISKYKERRRETENRMRHTEENLERLNDVREELEKRLQHLKRQATMAEKYKALKQEERKLRAELLAVRWRVLDGEAGRQAQHISGQETAVEAAVAAQRRVDAGLEKQRALQASVTEEFNESYRNVLDAGAEVARSEETIQHLREQRERFQHDLASEERALAEAQGHFGVEQRRLAAVRAELAELQPQVELSDAAVARAREELERHEQSVHESQLKWETLAQQAAETGQAAHSERARIEHLEEQLRDLHERRERRRGELVQLHPGQPESELAGLQQQLEQQQRFGVERQAELERKHKEIRDLRESHSEMAAGLHAARRQLQEQQGRLASLQALQQDALGKRPGAVMRWLTEQGLETRPRLAEVLEVEPGWERAVEAALGAHLRAVCVDDLKPLSEAIASLDEGVLTLLDPKALPSDATAGSAGESSDGARWLASKVSAPWPGVASLFAGVYAVEDLPDAWVVGATLRPGESAVTRTGDWVGSGWVRLWRETEASSGVLAREQEIKGLSGELETSQAEVTTWEVALEKARTGLQALEAEYGGLQTQFAAGHERLATLKSQCETIRAELQRRRARTEALERELAELGEQQAGKEAELAAARTRLEDVMQSMAGLTAERESCAGRRDEHRRVLTAAREQWQAERDASHQVGLKIAANTTEIMALEQALSRSSEQANKLERRCAELGRVLCEIEQPLAAASDTLESKLERRRTLEAQMKTYRQAVEEAESDLRALEASRTAAESRVQDQRAALEALRVECQAVLVRRETVAEQLAELGCKHSEVLERLPEGAEESEWEGRLGALQQRIVRLGPINLAAIEEFEQQSERRDYLDAQHRDLVEALETLRDAIGKIDRETKTRFKDTYESVNAGLGQIFPRLFGGGRAYLELTGSDLLSTGITVMARPPGKRNSTIHLLSGGEKALTAVALVFSLFELNPAPFCLLDEVDAPLDDANVGRFCGLVKEMSERLQLVLVTHNKTTMETSEQLVGVTMNEPGVSRLVAVDVDEAVAMAAV